MRAWLLSLCLICALWQRAAADPKVESKQHFDAASTAHKEGRFKDALTELMVAYALDPRPELLYAIGQIHVKLGQCPQAITFYQRFIDTKPKAEHAARAEKAIEICKTNPPPPEATTANPQQPREDLGLAAAENLRKAKEAEAVTATEKRKAEEARIAAERERAREKLYNRHPARKWAVVTAGVGTAALIAGGVFAVTARNAQSDFDNAGCGDRPQRLDAAALAQCQATADRGEQRARLANIFLGAGAAVATTGVIIFVIDPGNQERPELAKVAVGLSPTSIQLTARW
jgi:tetratricopeptide (TPR) repeat protein